MREHWGPRFHKGPGVGAWGGGGGLDCKRPFARRYGRPKLCKGPAVREQVGSTFRGGLGRQGALGSEFLKGPAVREHWGSEFLKRPAVGEHWGSEFLNGTRGVGALGLPNSARAPRGEEHWGLTCPQGPVGGGALGIKMSARAPRWGGALGAQIPQGPRGGRSIGGPNSARRGGVQIPQALGVQIPQNGRGGRSCVFEVSCMVALPFPIPQASVPQHCPFQFRRPPSNGGPDSADPEQWGPRLRNTLGNWGEGGGGPDSATKLGVAWTTSRHQQYWDSCQAYSRTSSPSHLR